MKRRSTTWPVSASSVATPCATPCTSTACVEAPTFSVKFTVAFSLTSTFILGRTVFSNPAISAVTEYSPGGIDRNKYDPVPSVVVLNVNPFHVGVRQHGPGAVGQHTADGSKIRLAQ
jgi:hypothetical protein